MQNTMLASTAARPATRGTAPASPGRPGRPAEPGWPRRPPGGPRPREGDAEAFGYGDDFSFAAEESEGAFRITKEPPGPRHRISANSTP